MSNSLIISDKAIFYSINIYFSDYLLVKKYSQKAPSGFLSDRINRARL